MGILNDDAVLIRVSEEEDEPSVITVNCRDKTGLGCDLCRIILFFGLTVVRTDMSTDGKWCYIVLWVVGKRSTRWSLLKKRLMEACPSCSLASVILSEEAETKPSDVFLLKFCCHDRKGLLHGKCCNFAAVRFCEFKLDNYDGLYFIFCIRYSPSSVILLVLKYLDREGDVSVSPLVEIWRNFLTDVTEVLCELELIIRKVKVSMTPDGKVMDLFFITDTRELLHTRKRKDDTYSHLRAVLGDSMISCEIEMVDSEITNSSQEPSFLSDAITEEMFYVETADEHQNSTVAFKRPSIMIDNLLSPGHSLVQIVCQDHKGLLFDVMRTFKDYNIQISYGRFTKKEKSECELDLFIMQADGKKIIDPSKQKSLCSRLRVELSRPLRVALINRGPDTELLIANPVELSGKGRPLVFYDITLALKILDKGIFLADIGRYMIGDREWEIYRVILDEGDNVPVSKTMIEETVWRMLMSWDL